MHYTCNMNIIITKIYLYNYPFNKFYITTYIFSALAMQLDKHSVGYLTYHGGIRSVVSTSVVRDTGL